MRGRRQPWAGVRKRSVVEANPHLLGCGQKNKQVDDAVLQGVEVLQGKGAVCGAWSAQ